MKPGNALETIGGDTNVFKLGDLLDRKVVANGARTVPDEVMYRSKRIRVADQVVEKVVACFLGRNQWQWGESIRAYVP